MITLRTLPKPAKKLKVTKVKNIVDETVLALVLSPNREIAAKRLGLSEDGLFWRMRQYPEIKELLKEIPAEARARLQAGSLGAAEVFIRNLANPQKDMEAAKEILDRVGVVKEEKPSVLQRFDVGGEMTLEFIGPNGEKIT